MFIRQKYSFTLGGAPQAKNVLSELPRVSESTWASLAESYHLDATASNAIIDPV
jgi:hypothetical protein